MAYTTIKKPSDYFNTKLWTGTGSSNALTGVGFQPDWTWIKNRTDANSHVLQDVVRGVGNTIISNNTDAESAEGAGDLTAFGSDGFTVGTNGRVNGSGKSMVAWNWKANGAGSANTDGSTATTVSVNTTAGFSIVKWTGTSGNTTIGHGLGVIPSVVIAKNTGGSGTNWTVYHKDLSSGYYVKLNLTNAQDNGNAYFTADPTNSILSLTGNTAANSNGNNMIAYCFNDVQGFSKFSSYTGNASNDGPFIYTGFKPAFLIIKRSDTGQPWLLLDNKRGASNVNQSKLFPNTSDAENTDTSNGVDFLSNGFKLRRNNGESNESGTYIYMAFAEEPLVGDNPATAR